MLNSQLSLLINPNDMYKSGNIKYQQLLLLLMSSKTP